MNITVTDGCQKNLKTLCLNAVDISRRSSRITFRGKVCTVCLLPRCNEKHHVHDVGRSDAKAIATYMTGILCSSIDDMIARETVGGNVNWVGEDDAYTADLGGVVLCVSSRGKLSVRGVSSTVFSPELNDRTLQIIRQHHTLTHTV